MLSMCGVGIAWASILSMPYAILSRPLPPARMGVYMGVFNFFIVLPEILAGADLRAADPHARSARATRTRRSTSSSSAGVASRSRRCSSRGWRTRWIVPGGGGRVVSSAYLPAHAPAGTAVVHRFPVAQADGRLMGSTPALSSETKNRKTENGLCRVGQRSLLGASSFRFSRRTQSTRRSRHSTDTRSTCYARLVKPAEGRLSSPPTRACGPRASLCDGVSTIGPGPRRR